MKRVFLFSWCLLTLFSQVASCVDVVYTWVDGTDEDWLAKKKKYFEKEDKSLLTTDGHGIIRFQDRDELKYSLRSIQQFAPWVHHVYIVTAGQKPKWFKKNHFVTIVDHKTIFKDPDVLPVFNSHAIEANLHHIPDLEEEYLYLNDDVFIGRPATRSDFFTEDGKAKVFVHGNMASGPVNPKDGSWIVANKNAANLLSQLFGRGPRACLAHTIQPCRKSAAYAAEELLPDIFALVSSHRFRSLKDYGMTNGLIPHIAIQEGKAVKTSIPYGYTHCGGHPDGDLRALESLKVRRPLSICIQDGGTHPLCKKHLKLFFEEYFPNPAPWEKDESSKSTRRSGH